MFRLISAGSLLLAAAFAVAPLAAAQAPPRADPLDAKASVPGVSYRSSLAGYRAFADDKLTPWKEANDTAARIGGWRAYAREAREPAPAASAAAGHDAHKPK